MTSKEGDMEPTLSYTFRMPESLRSFLQGRAMRHDRSVNKELCAILREIQRDEEASGTVCKLSSDAASLTNQKEIGYEP